MTPKEIGAALHSGIDDLENGVRNVDLYNLVDRLAALAEANERKPLTDEEIDQLVMQCKASHHARRLLPHSLARDIELAHNIKEST